MATVQAYTKSGVDAKFNSRSNMTMVHGGGGSPDISAYPDAKTGDVIERSSDGARWGVVASSINPIAGRVVSVGGKTGVVTLGPGDVGAAPSGHTHTKAQITDLNASTVATANSIAQRGTGGTLVVGTPTYGEHATTKTYVDSRVTGGITWANLSGKPTTFPPSSHTHTISQITDLKIAYGNEANSIPKRDASGRFRVGNPAEVTDVANKGYVDSAVSSGTTWSSLSGKPSTFPPSTHTHTVANITDLNISYSSTGETVVIRDANGRIRIGDPTLGEHAATKSYVDDQIPDLNISYASTGDTIAMRDADGRIRIGNPNVGEHATTKSYVDNAVTSSKAWSAITGKPTAFTPSSHTHTVSQISDLNLSMYTIANTVVQRTPSGHIRSPLVPVGVEDSTSKSYVDAQITASKAWAAITGKPATFPPSTHSHTQAQVTGLPAKLTAYDAVADKVYSAKHGITGSTTDAGSLISLSANGRITSVDPLSGTHVANKQYVDSEISAKTTWDNTSGKPSTFPPSPHGHTVSDITGLTLSQNATGSSVAQRDSSGRVTVGTPSATGHATTKAYVDNAVTAGKAWSAITGKPSTFTPSAHTHTISQITDVRLSIYAQPDVLVQRTPSGHIRSPLVPVGAEDSTSKSYVDSRFKSSNLTTQDLNSMVTPGNRYQGLSANATTDRNYPPDARAGHLVVIQGGDYVKQEYTDYEGGSMHYRTKYLDTWYPWQSISQSTV